MATIERVRRGGVRRAAWWGGAGAVVACVLAFAPGRAMAAEIEEQVATVEGEVHELSRRTEGLTRHAAPGRGFVTEQQAIQRYEDCLYAYMIGEYERAAEGFFSLVTTASLTDAGLHRDSEWYLAEALLELGNLQSAEVQYRVIADDPQHPFRDDAVRRILEVLARSGRTEEFYDLYEREIVLGRVRPSDLIRYSVAKSFYQQGDLVKAKSNFLDQTPESSQYHKSRYFLGAIMVQEGNLEQAAQYFRDNVDMSVDSTEDRKILDLSLLALGRVYYELGQFDEATEFYGRVGGDSDYLADKLYEIVWCFIKQEEFAQAQRAVEIFLLAYPEHEYTAQLRLLQGHLFVKDVDYDDALVAYEDVITQYEPVAERFAEYRASSSQPREVFRDMLDEEARAASGAIPPYAYAMMEADPDLSRALAVFRELEAEEEDIAESQRLIRELEVVLGGGPAIGGFEMIRYEAIFTYGVAVQQHLAVLALEGQWLATARDGAVAADVAALEAEREALMPRVLKASAEDERELAAYQERVRGLQQERTTLLGQVESLQSESANLREALASGTMSPADASLAERDLARVDDDLARLQGELDALVIDVDDATHNGDDLGDVRDVAEEVRRLQDRYAAVRKDARLTGDPVAGRIDAMYGAVRAAQDDLVALLPRLGNMEGDEIERIRKRFQHEVSEVGRQETSHAALLAEAENVSEDLTRVGFGRLEDFFADSVLRADMGVVDVYWSQKLEVQAEREDLVARKKRILDQLDRRFEVIRQKLNP